MGTHGNTAEEARLNITGSVMSFRGMQKIANGDETTSILNFSYLSIYSVLCDP